MVLFSKNVVFSCKIPTIFGRSMKSKLNKRRGFTIVEVLIAVAIMAILITAVMNGITGAKAEARKKIWQTEVDKETLHAIELVEQRMTNNPNETDATVAAAVKPSLRKDPTGGTYTLTIAAGKVTLAPSQVVKDVGVSDGTGSLWE